MSKRLFLLFCISFFLGLGATTHVMAQETTATISGQITDSLGAVVSGANITLTNINTHEQRQITSDADGYYTLTSVQPGVYDLSVASQGFKEYLNKNIELFVNDKKSINIPLETGGVSETVTVVDVAPIIQTTPTVGDVIENRRVVELPLNDRNFQQLIRLVPGVSSASGSPGLGLANVANFSINGTRRNSVNWLVDGVANSDVGSNLTLLAIPTVDSIQEFRILTSVPSAEFGRAAGGIVNLVTRGGTSDFHGGVYEFLRNDSLNANNFLNNAQGTDPVTGLGRSPRPSLRYNNFGWNLGGPVYIPGLYEQRDKTFFFFSEEWRRIIRQTDTPVTVPSLRQRQGDFSEAGNLTIIDPLTGIPFPGNKIPADRLDPTSVALLNLIPEPNLPSATSGRDPNRFLVTAPNFQNTRQETVRVDHSLSQNHRLMGRYTHDLSSTSELGGLFLNIALPDLATTNTNIPGQILAISLTSSFGPNIVNEVSFNYSSNLITTELVGQYTRDNVDIVNSEIFPENDSNLPPTINTGINTLAANQLFNINYKNFNPKENLTWIHGRHTIKAGVDLSFESKNENSAGATQGTFGFTGTQTQGGALTGIAFADFLLGRASSYTEAEQDVANNLRFGRTEFYVQDTWKIRSNFQLDYGLRYYLFRQPYDTENVLTAFLPELYDPASAPQFADARGSALIAGTGDLLNGIAVADQSSPFGQRVQQTDKNDFAPRFGFAWSPWKDEKTVIRGGYGIYYDQSLVGTVEQNSFTNPPFNNSASFTGTVSAPITYDDPAGGVVSALSVRSLITTSSPFVTPLIQQWNLTIQRELSNKSSFEIGYTGSAGNHLIRPVDINAPTPEELLAVSVNVPGCNTPTTANNCINLARPFKGYGAITDRQTTATSRYHALISSFRLRPAHGLTAQIAYTFSKNLTDATNDRDAVDQPQIRTDFSLERAVSRLDRTHVFVASYVYELPLPQSEFFTRPVARQVFGGWQIAGITTAQSGLPLTQVTANTFVPRGGRVDIVSDPLENVPGDVGTTNPYFFNPLAFLPAGVGEIGNSGRAIFRFPRQVFTDLELAKNWRWGERYNVQFRAEFFNIFNNTIFTSAIVTLPNNRLSNDPIFNSLDAFLATGSTLGQFNGTISPREIQFGLKFSF